MEKYVLIKNMLQNIALQLCKADNKIIHQINAKYLMQDSQGLLHSEQLDALGHKYLTDKSSKHAHAHDYLRKYEFFFAPFKNSEFLLMELGVYQGASLKTWYHFFPLAKIIGVDIRMPEDCPEGDRLELITGHLGSIEFLQMLAERKPFVLIDDASHRWEHQLKALFTLFPQMPPGALYIVEDTHSSFAPFSKTMQGKEMYAPYLVLTKVAEYMTGNESTAPTDSTCLITPLEKAPCFHEEIRQIANMTDAVVFLERSVILIKK